MKEGKEFTERKVNISGTEITIKSDDKRYMCDIAYMFKLAKDHCQQWVAKEKMEALSCAEAGDNEEKAVHEANVEYYATMQATADLIYDRFLLCE